MYVYICLNLNFTYMILHLYFMALVYFAYMIITKSLYFPRKIIMSFFFIFE